MEETHKETPETVETVSEQTEEIQAVQETVPVDLPSDPKPKKHHIAKQLVGEAKELVERSEAQLQECRLLLESDLKAYNEGKAELRANALGQSEAYLEELGYDPSEEEEDTTLFEPAEEIPPVQLKDVSSGKFTAFIMAVLIGVAALVGLIYLATEKLQMTLDISKTPDQNTLEKIFGWFAHVVGYDGVYSFYVGLALVTAAILLLMALYYWIRVALKANKNLHFAQKQLENVKEYVSQKTNCKEEMDKVDAHIKDAIATLKDYEVLLAEQNGKLRRILHFEGFHDDQREYSERSQETMQITQSLVETIKRFIATPMSEEGKLSGKSTLFLHSAKEKIRKVLEALAS